mgnify:CR=1 FL=1
MINDKKQKYIELNNNITNDKTLKKCYIYVITKPIRVSAGVTLTVENGTIIYLLNKPIEENIIIPPNFDPNTNNNTLIINGSCLIFESGSKLKSEDIYVSSCDSNYIPQSINQNCGIFFNGTRATTTIQCRPLFSSANPRSMFSIAPELKLLAIISDSSGVPLSSASNTR